MPASQVADPEGATRAAQEATRLADEAYDRASSEFGAWDGGGGPVAGPYSTRNAGGGDLAGAILGGIIGGVLSGGGRGSGWGGSPWGGPMGGGSQGGGFGLPGSGGGGGIGLPGPFAAGAAGAGAAAVEVGSAAGAGSQRNPRSRVDVATGQPDNRTRRSSGRHQHGTDLDPRAHGQLVRANVNALLDQAEDPEKMLDQLVRDFTNNIAEAEEAVAQTIGNLRLMEDDAREARRGRRRLGDKAKAASTGPTRCAAQANTAEADRFDASPRWRSAGRSLRTADHDVRAADRAAAPATDSSRTA